MANRARSILKAMHNNSSALPPESDVQDIHAFSSTVHCPKRRNLTHRKPLYPLTLIMRIDGCLEMLIEDLALQLHHLPLNSRVIARIPGHYGKGWSDPAANRSSLSQVPLRPSLPYGRSPRSPYLLLPLLSMDESSSAPATSLISRAAFKSNWD
jgi:hypothetical protein